jgi:tight adherence protein C
MNETIALATFVAVSSFVLLIVMLVRGRKSRLETRLEDLSGSRIAVAEAGGMMDFARSALPAIGAPLLPQEEEERTRLRTRLIHAGLYGREAVLLFLGVKMLLFVGPALLGILAGIFNLVEFRIGLFSGAFLGIFGLVGPSFWLDKRKKARQTTLRRSLPDALDLLVICLEGGLSLPAALRRVVGELRTAHPVLAIEVNIVQREIQMGQSPGDAMRQFAGRADLEEVRTLASVIIQTEKFGASLVKSLRVHAETLRTKRLQYAEEMAQKAATKVLFPTVLFVLPCLFIVILGPGVIQIADVFAKMSK